MKIKYVVGILVCALMVVSLGLVAEAAQKQKPKAAVTAPAATAPAATAPAATTAPAPAVETPAEQLKAAALEKAQKALSLHEWTVYITPADAKERANMETDVLTFANGKLTVRNLFAQGYPESNYSLAVQDDGTAVWETMQAKELPDQIDLVFLRGALFPDGTTLSGSMTMQPQKGAKKTFNFSTVMPTITPVTQTTEAAPVVTKAKKGRK